MITLTHSKGNDKELKYSKHKDYDTVHSLVENIQHCKLFTKYDKFGRFKITQTETRRHYNERSIHCANTNKVTFS